MTAPETGPPPGIPDGLSAAREQRELGDEAGQRRQAGEQQRAADEGKPEQGHRRGDGDADLVLLVDVLVVLAIASRVTASMSAPGSRPRSTSSTSRKKAPMPSVELTR